MSRSPVTANSALAAAPNTKPQIKHQPHRLAEALAVARAVGLAADLLGGGGDAVEEEGADQREVVQHRVGGKCDVAGARTARGEEGEGRNQRRGADHDVAVDRQHAREARAVEQHGAREIETPADDAPGGGDARRETEDLRDHRGERRAGDAEIEAQHQHHHQHDVDDIEGDLDRHGCAHIGEPHQPARHDVVGEREGRRPDAHEEIGARRRRHLRAAAHGVEDERGERRLHHDDDEADGAGDQ